MKPAPRKLGGKGAQPVESADSAQIRRCDEARFQQRYMSWKEGKAIERANAALAQGLPR